MKPVLIVVASVLLLSGCSAPAAETTSPAPSPSVTRSETPTAKPAPTRTPSATPAAAAPVVVTPASEDEPTYDDEIFLTALGTIDPGLAHERSLGRAANVCLDIEQGKDSTTILVNMEARFEGGTVPNLSGGQLAALLNLIRTTCG